MTRLDWLLLIGGLVMTIVAAPDFAEWVLK